MTMDIVLVGCIAGVILAAFRTGFAPRLLGIPDGLAARLASPLPATEP